MQCVPEKNANTKRKKKEEEWFEKHVKHVLHCYLVHYCVYRTVHLVLLYGTLAQFFFSYQNCSSAAEERLNAGKLNRIHSSCTIFNEKYLLFDHKKKKNLKPQNQINVMRAIGKFPY